MSTAYPVLEILPPLKQQLSEKNIVILQAPPGAGKSTVLPLQLLDEPWLRGKKMIMLEPRRLAARSVAFRMASLQGENVGETIGYRIRFETKVTSRTRIEVVTEGILTRMIQSDNTLEGVGLIIFDEFHERSLQADLALALCLQVQKILRDDLRILIMSATLDGAMLSSLLGNAPVISTSGRQFHVNHHSHNFDPEADIQVRMARAIRKALLESTGDILAFLPGASEIRRTQTLLEAENIGAVVYALYGDLPMKKQQEAILPLSDKKRKVVLATSIAETPLTIDGITVVVDCGYSRVPRFDPRSGLTRLETIRVTRDAADQRAGRAGRMGPGVCYRLWGEGMNASLVLHRSPEILDADLAPLILELGLWGVNDVRELTWITPPPAGAVSQAKELLKQLEAIDEGRITDRGKQMLQLPTHPRIAHMLLISTPTSPSPPANRGSAAPIAIGAKVGGEVHVALATDIAALLEEKDPLPREAGADLTLRLEVLRKWRRGEKVNAEINSLERIERLAESWRRVFKIAVTNSAVADEEVGKLRAGAYPERIGRQGERNSELYKLAHRRGVLHSRHHPVLRELQHSLGNL